MPLPLPGDAEQVASRQAGGGRPQNLLSASSDFVPPSGSPKRTGHGVDSVCFESELHGPETLGRHHTFSSLLMFRVEVLQVIEGMGSPEASQVRVTCSSNSMAVWFSTYVILGFAEKAKTLL